MWDNYYSVTSIAEALQLLDDHGEKARIIAGGTDILIELEQGKRPAVTALIDLTRVPGLSEIRLHGDHITLGCLVTHNHAVASELLRERALPLVQACWEVGAPQIRNRATIAGNLVTASPANDTIVPLLALGATVTLACVEGERQVPLRDFYSGFRQTVMRPNELLTGISFPALQSYERGMFIKLGLRRAQAISVVNTAVVLSYAQDDTVAQAAIALGSVAPTVIRTPVAEKALIGKKLSSDVIADVARLAAATPAPIDDVRSTAEYRTEMVRVLVSRALRAIAAGTEADQLPQEPAMLLGENYAHTKQVTIDGQANHDAQQAIEATINGQTLSINTGQHKTLLHWIREDVGLTGTKEGCSEGECGACTVFLDGAAVMACMVAAPRAHGAEVTTIEGLQDGDKLHPLQASFVKAGAVQCGFCTPGFVMAGAKLLEEQPRPNLTQIQQSISGNLCRCTGYYKIIEAFKEASESLAAETKE